jgi:hypothetical protein
VPRRTRILAYGAAFVVTAAGFGCAAIGGLGAQIAAIALVSAGLGGALLFAFYEVGLSEDRDRAEEEEKRRLDDRHGRRDDFRRPPWSK